MNPASKAGWPQGFVFYDEADLIARKQVVETFSYSMRSTLQDVNRAVRFVQVETPCLTPREALRGHVDTGFELVRTHDSRHGGEGMILRPETTFGTYAAMRTMYPMEPQMKKALPLVLWQYGKSFRDEQARPMAELRFREFYQLEFQLFYSPDSGADYASACNKAVASALYHLTHDAGSILSIRPVPAAELAHYSEATFDHYLVDTEVAAISLRKDFGPSAKVVEVSVGLDRVAWFARQRMTTH